MRSAVLVLTILLSSCLAKVPLDQFFTFGVANGDSLMVGQADGSSPAIPLLMNYRLFSYYHNSLYVNVNGGVSFIKNFGIPPSQCSLLPSSGMRTVGVFLGHMHSPVNITYKERVDAPTLQRANNILRQVYPDYKGNVNWTFIATYYNNTGYFPSCNDTNFKPSNTYQLVLSSDGYNSFVFFLYNDINYIATDFESSNCGQNVRNAARAGFDAGDGVYSLMLPGSCTSDMYTINERSNVGVPGLWVYAVGDSTVVPPIGTLEPPDEQTTPEPVLPTERDCACTYENIWLDISFLVESSSSMTRPGLNQISFTLAAVAEQMRISQTIDQATRATVAVYADNVTAPGNVQDFSTYATTGALEDAFVALGDLYFNETNGNLLLGMQYASAQFVVSRGHRSFARKVIVIVAASYAVGGITDVIQAATTFKASNGVIIVLAYQQPGSIPIPQICDLATPGMCFFADASQNNEHLVATMLQAFCIANCFCFRNDYLYTAGNFTNPIYRGECVRGVVAPTTGGLAERECLREENGRLTLVLTDSKRLFMTNFSITVLGTDKSWVGIRYNATLVPPGWYWRTLDDEYFPVRGTIAEYPNDEYWMPGSPDLRRGECVILIRKTGFGFTLAFESQQCTGIQYTHSCQYRACDTDKFCPDALGKTIEEAHQQK